MKKGFPFWAVFVIVISLLTAGIGLSLISPYNKIISLQETADTKEANIQTQLQARFDKISEMLPVVESALGSQNDLNEQLQQMAGSIPNTSVVDGKIIIDANASLDELEQTNESAAALTSKISEALGEMSDSNSLASDYLVAIEGIENRISVARKNYNEAVEDYNAYLKKFPSNLVASLFGFEPMEKFSASN
jgi:LemA protein